MSFACGLKPAQWVALRYLDRANESARTVTRFAQFHATSKSAASQTIAVLIEKGLVRAQPHAEDPRTKILSLTAKGRRVFQDNPLNGIGDVLGSLPPAQLEAFAESLERLIAWTLESDRDSDEEA